MIIDPINLTNIFSAIAWPLFGYLAIRVVCKTVAAVKGKALDHELIKETETKQ
jgi:hypothetical protein